MKSYVEVNIWRSPVPLLGVTDVGVGAEKFVTFAVIPRLLPVAGHADGRPGSRNDARATASPEAARFSSRTADPLTATIDQEPPEQIVAILVLPIDWRAEIRL